MTTSCVESRSRDAATFRSARPINPALSTAKAGCSFSLDSFPSQVAITIDNTATEQQITACAAGLYHRVCALPQSDRTRAAGVKAAKNARNNTGRMLRSSDIDASGTARKYSLADIDSTRHKCVFVFEVYLDFWRD